MNDTRKLFLVQGIGRMVPQLPNEGEEAIQEFVEITFENSSALASSEITFESAGRAWGRSPER